MNLCTLYWWYHWWYEIQRLADDPELSQQLGSNYIS